MPKRSDTLISIVIFAAVALVYSALPTRNYYWDGVEFAQTIENAHSLNTTLLHANHLIYNVFGWLLYSTVEPITGLRALYVLQYANCIFAAGAVVALFRILRANVASLTVSVSFALLFAFSAAWWKFATDADAYIPSIFFMLLSLNCVVTTRWPRPVAAGLMLAVAICFHQLAFLFFPVILLAIWTRSYQDRLRSAFSYALSAIVPVALAYVGAFFAVTGSIDPSALFRWATTYSNETGFVANFSQSLGYTLSGEIKLFFAGRISYFVETLDAISIAGAVILGVLVIMLVIAAFRRSTRVDYISSHIRPQVTVFILWPVIYIAFLFFFIPQNVFYRLFYLPALIALLTLVADGGIRSKRSRRVLGFIVAIVSVVNFLVSTYPMSKVRSDTPLSLAFALNKTWNADTTVIYALPNSDARLVQYFNPSTTWLERNDVDPEQLDTLLNEHPSQNLWLETTAIKNLSTRLGADEWLPEHTAQTVVLDNGVYYLKFVRLK